MIIVLKIEQSSSKESFVGFFSFMTSVKTIIFYSPNGGWVLNQTPVIFQCRLS